MSAGLISTHRRCCVHLPVPLLPCWILGRRRETDGGPGLCPGKKEGQLGTEDKNRVSRSTGRRGSTSAADWGLAAG